MILTSEGPGVLFQKFYYGGQKEGWWGLTHFFLYKQFEFMAVIFSSHILWGTILHKLLKHFYDEVVCPKFTIGVPHLPPLP